MNPQDSELTLPHQVSPCLFLTFYDFAGLCEIASPTFWRITREYLVLLDDCVFLISQRAAKS
jgi:hypothetical protein